METSDGAIGRLQAAAVVVWLLLAVASCGPDESTTPHPTLADPTETPTPDGPRGPGLSRHSGCRWFDTWSEAIAFYMANGGPESDRFFLDLDGDGIPCERLLESNPPPENQPTVPPKSTATQAPSPTPDMHMESEPKREASPMLDVNYDDSWVANIPEVVSGYKVIRILTPKNTSCIVTPEINFQSPRRSMDEFLNDPPSIDSLEKELQSIPGVPSDIILGFSSKPLDPEIYAARQQILNEARLRNGCTKMGGPVKIGNPEDQ